MLQCVRKHGYSATLDFIHGERFFLHVQRSAAGLVKSAVETHLIHNVFCVVSKCGYAEDLKTMADVLREVGDHV